MFFGVRSTLTGGDDVAGDFVLFCASLSASIHGVRIRISVNSLYTPSVFSLVLAWNARPCLNPIAREVDCNETSLRVTFVRDMIGSDTDSGLVVMWD